MANLGMVVADFNPEITRQMEQVAIKEARSQKANVISILHVPGVYEIPFAVSMLLKRRGIDAVVALGAVIRGGTAHDEVIAHAVAKELLRLGVDSKKPVSLGILGPKISWQQAAKRAETYARRAVIAAIRMAKLRCDQK